MADRVDVALVECNRSLDAFTSLGQWGWGLSVSFASGVLFASANHELLPPWPDGKTVALGLLLAFACLVYSSFVIYAWRRVCVVRSLLDAMPGDDRLAWALDGGYRNQTSRGMLAFRLTPMLLVAGVYYALADF